MKNLIRKLIEILKEHQIYTKEIKTYSTTTSSKGTCSAITSTSTSSDSFRDLAHDLISYLEEAGYIVIPKETRCFLHKWDKWEDIYEKKLNGILIPKSMQGKTVEKIIRYQKRKCLVCNKKQIEKL